MFDKYPIGTVVRLSDDNLEDEPHEVVGHKQIGGSDYLIFRTEVWRMLGGLQNENRGM